MLGELGGAFDRDGPYLEREIRLQGRPGCQDLHYRRSIARRRRLMESNL